MRRTRRRPVIFDLEFTAWEGSMARGWSTPGEYKEVVQIGAVALDPETFHVTDTLDLLVRPRVNPVPSEYLVALTGITPARLADLGLDFATAYRLFLDFAIHHGGPGAPCWAYGRDDAIFAANLELYVWKTTARLPDYHDVRPWFAEHGVDLTGKRACDVAEAAGVTFSGHKHDALDDARGVAAGMAALIARGARNPFA